MAMTLGTLEYLISVKTGDIDSQLGKAESTVKGFGNKLSMWTVAKGTMIGQFATKAISATANMIKDTVKSVISAYGTFEQLEGGTKLLFGSAYDFVMKKSAEAYKNVQISQNEYLEQANRFATGLKTSLKGDEQAAASLADRIITAQADVVAATGASRESVQNAFAGLMKGNYTMLDNLQLGIAGTKQGMKDVIKQVNAWNKENGKATKYQLGNLADMSNALIDYIEMQGLAGYANMEASKTLEGSVASTKAAWQDLLVSMGKGKGVKDATKNFAKAAKNMLMNLKPVAKDAFKGLVEGAKTILPDVLEIGRDLVNEIGRGIFGKDWDITINWIQNAWSDVQDAFNVAVGWVDNAYKIGVNWVQNAWQTVSNALTKADEWVDNTYRITVNWVQNAWRTVKNALSTAEEWLDNSYRIAVNWVQKGWVVVKGALAKAGEWLGNAYEIAVKWVQNGWVVVKGAFNKAAEWIDKKINTAVNWANNAWDTVSSSFTEAGEWADKTFNTTINWIRGTWTTLNNAFTEAGKWANKTFRSTVDWIRGTWDDLAEAFDLAGTKVWESTVNFILGIVKPINDFIASIPKTIEVAVNFVKHVIGAGTNDTGVFQGGEPSGLGWGESFDIPGTPSWNAKGNWYVPYDNYPSLLHRGEMVLNKSQARQLRDGSNGTDINSAVASAVTAAMSKVYVMMSGEKVGDLTTKRIKRNINANSYSRMRALGG